MASRSEWWQAPKPACVTQYLLPMQEQGPSTFALLKLPQKVDTVLSNSKVTVPVNSAPSFLRIASTTMEWQQRFWMLHSSRKFLEKYGLFHHISPSRFITRSKAHIHTTALQHFGSLAILLQVCKTNKSAGLCCCSLFSGGIWWDHTLTSLPCTKTTRTSYLQQTEVSSEN